MIKPTETSELIALAGTTEVDLGTVPTTKVARKIYGYMFNEQSGATNTLTLRVYNGTTNEKELSITLPAYGTLTNNDFPGPWLTVPAGRTLKAVASAASIQVVLQYYDV